MFEWIKAVIAGLKSDPLPTICGLLIFTVAYLGADIRDTHKRWDKREFDYRIESVEREKRCAEKVYDVLAFYQGKLDSIAVRELRRADTQAKELNLIIKTLKRR